MIVNGDMVIGRPNAIATDPYYAKNVSVYINLTNRSAGVWLYLNLSYNESLVTDENRLQMYKNNSTGWYNPTEGGWNTEYSINNVSNYVYANITSFSVFAPMEQTAIPLNITVYVNTVQTNNLTNKGEPQNLTVVVKNNATGAPISNANVTVYEKSGLLLFSLPQYSDSNVSGTAIGASVTNADGAAMITVIPAGSVGHSSEIGPYLLYVKAQANASVANVTLQLTNDSLETPSHSINIPNKGNVGGDLNTFLSIWSYAVGWYNLGGGDAISMTVFENGTGVGDNVNFTKAKPVGFTITVRNDTSVIPGATVIVNETNGYQLWALHQYADTNVTNLGSGNTTTDTSGTAKLTVIPTGGITQMPYSMDVYAYLPNGTLVYSKSFNVNQSWVEPTGTQPSVPNAGNVGGYLNALLSVWSYAVGWFNY
jgi:hypothetical protein